MPAVASGAKIAARRSANFSSRRAAFLVVQEPAEIDRRVKEVADLLGLADLLGRHPHELSGGQQQRVALGRALVRRPAVLLLDEPLAHLDTPLRKQVRDDVTRLRRRFGITSIWVTHDPDEAAAVGDRVAEMEAGKVVRTRLPTGGTDAPAGPR